MGKSAVKIKQLIHVRNMVFRAASIEAIELSMENDKEILVYVQDAFEGEPYVVEFDTPEQARQAFVKLAADWADYMNSQ